MAWAVAERRTTATTRRGPRQRGQVRTSDAVARKNVELTIARLQEISPVVRELVASKTLKIAGAMYDLSNAKVDFLT